MSTTTYLRGDGKAHPYVCEDPYAELDIRQAISMLPERDRTIVEKLEDGFSAEQLAKCDVSKDHLNVMRQNMNSILQTGSASMMTKGMLLQSLPKAYWEEFFKQHRLAYPVVIMTRSELNSLPVYGR